MTEFEEAILGKMDELLRMLTTHAVLLESLCSILPPDVRAHAERRVREIYADLEDEGEVN